MKTEKVSTKKNKRSYIIIALIIILLLLGVGYASFSETLTISGTAEGNMKWDVHFEATDSEGVEEEVTNGGHGLTVTTSQLKYPGDAVKATAKIKNASSVDIVLKKFDFVNNETESDIKVTYEKLTPETEKIEAGSTCTYEFVITWDKDSKNTNVSDTYTFTFEYQQDTTTIELTPSHDSAQHKAE